MRTSFGSKLKFWQATAVIMSATIGAGVLGMPYAIAQVGLPLGIIYIVSIGFLMTGLNLMLGEIAVRTKQELHVVGLAKKYLGIWGGWTMAGLVYIMHFGVLTIYIIGMGDSLAALFGGVPFWWSIIAFLGSFFLVIGGLERVKTINLFLSAAIVTVILIFVAKTFPHISTPHVVYTHLAQLFLPYGVILFAFHAVTSIPEAHKILEKSPRAFERAVILAGSIITLLYLLFAIGIVGMFGDATTQIATIGLGRAFGPGMLWFGNLFALLAMGTSFIFVGIALKDSLHFDLRLSKATAIGLVCGVPLVLFVAGLREFIGAIDLIGGVFCSVEMMLILLIYWKATHLGDLPKGKYHLHHTVLLSVFLFAAFAIGAGYSVMKIFF